MYTTQIVGLSMALSGLIAPVTARQTVTPAVTPVVTPVGTPVAIPVVHSPLPSGTVLAAFEHGVKRLRGYSPSGNLVFTYDHPSWEDSGSGRQVAVDRDRHIWVSDVKSQSLYELGSNGKFLRSLQVQFPCASFTGAGIRGFTFGPMGAIFVLGGWNSGTVNALVKIEPETGTTLACYPLTFEAADIAAGDDGDLYVTGYHGNVYRIDSGDGSVLGVISTGSCQMTPTLLQILALRGGRFLVASSNGGTPASGNILIIDPSAPEPCAGAVSFAFAGGPSGIEAWGGRYYGGGHDMRIHSLDVVTHEVHVSFPTGPGVANASSIAVIP